MKTTKHITDKEYINNPEELNLSLFFNSISQWLGQPYSTIDCSHLVWELYEANGLGYNYAQHGFTAGFAGNPKFTSIEEDELMDGDVIVILTGGTGHMGTYVSLPPEAGKNLLSSTSSGVRYEAVDAFIDDDPAPDEESSIAYYRWCLIV